MMQKLDVSYNSLSSLQEELSNLRNLKDLVADCNCFPTVPVSVLSRLTALTNISMRNQRFKGSEHFKVSSSLLPILHAGLVKLDLTQEAQWGQLSIRHLVDAQVEAAGRTPQLTLMCI